MNLPESVLFILQRLNAHGFSAYVVGGCVRDSLCGILPADYDICTSALPQQIKDCFVDQRILETGIRHGTVSILLEGKTYEVTTFRQDSDYKDGRHPDSVTFVGDLTEDLARRDFTINAMAYHPSTGVVDPFGGKKDLEAGIIRTVGDPNLRLAEDALRILRGLRFSSVFGFEIEKQTAKAIHENKEKLHSISSERIKVECDKLLCGQNVEKILLSYHDVFSVFIPELAPLYRYDQHSHHHCFDLWEHTVHALEGIEPTPLLRWTMLLHDIGKPTVQTFDSKGESHYKRHPSVGAKMAQNILDRLKFDTATKKKILLLILAHDADLPTDIPMLRRRMSQIGGENYLLLLQVKLADNAAKAPASAIKRDSLIRELLKAAQQILTNKEPLSVSDLQIRGNDLAAYGYKGREIGKELRQLLLAVLNDEIENQKTALLQKAADDKIR
jgi:tRNA nucleotidyltransferase (CCA-adding enzyme)